MYSNMLVKNSAKKGELSLSTSRTVKVPTY